MVCAESDLLQLKSAQETSLVPTSTCCSVVAPCLVTARDRHTDPVDFLARREGAWRCTWCCMLFSSCLRTTHLMCMLVSLEGLGCFWENLKEPREQKLAGLATACPGRSAWQQGGHWLLAGMLEAQRALAASLHITLSTASGGKYCIPGKSFHPDRCQWYFTWGHLVEEHHTAGAARPSSGLELAGRRAALLQSMQFAMEKPPVENIPLRRSRKQCSVNLLNLILVFIPQNLFCCFLTGKDWKKKKERVLRNPWFGGK